MGAVREEQKRSCMSKKIHDKNLYHIRILKTYLEYLRKYYPDLDIDYILQYAGITRSQLSDEGYWYTQTEADRFHEIVDKLTRNPNIAREAGRYGATSSSYGTIRQYIFSFIDPALAYELLGKIGSKLTKGTTIKIRRIDTNKVEALFDINPGVEEKPYSCQNRLGMMEALAIPFTGEYATVEHPECIHREAHTCKYFITWNVPLSLRMKRWRNLILLTGLGVILSSILLLPYRYTSILADIFLLCLLTMTVFIGIKEKQDLQHKIEGQGRTADQLMTESDRRFNDAELIQDIGQAISNLLDVEDLLRAVMSTLKEHLEYDRGMVLLANSDNTRLAYKAGYGYSHEEDEFFRANELHLDRPEARGPFVVAFRDQKPYLVNDVSEIMENLSPRSRDLVRLSGAKSFICVPIVYENESLGVLSLDNTKSLGPPNQSDLNLLMGIAPQIAISINNARTFEKMQASEEKYRDLVESANSIIIRIDTQGTITFANRFAQEFYGYSEHEMIGKNIMGFIVPEKDVQGRPLFPVIRKFLAHPEEYVTRENENILRNGDRVWISWSNKAIYGKDGGLREILCVGNDITPHKQAEYEKRQLEAQLIRAQKMEAIGSLAGGVAHDLNNILSGITSYPELLLMELPDDSPMRKAVTTIKKTGEKAAAMVQDLLTLARRGVSISNAVDLNAIVRDYFESPEFDRLKEYHPFLTVELQLDDGLKYILGSEVHLGKTIMNLVSNAAEAMPDGGTVIVRTENKYLEKPLKGYDTVARGEYVVLSVADTGIGISDEDLKKIFEPFFSKKVMGRSGTGLGMTVVWSTVKDHNAYINVESREGSGTRFDLYFPVTRSLIKDKVVTGSLQDHAGSERVLVVDDAEEQREITRSVLRKIGYQVTTASCGEEALDFLKNHDADLVILDMIMDPGIDGLETYQKILDLKGSQKAIIVSGFSETERVKKAMAMGVGTYIRKPYSLNDLARAVRTELNRR